MFKRVRWVSTGVAVGFGGSIWLQRKMKDAAARYRPAGVAASAASRARDALEEGRAAMREREAELRGSTPADRGAKPVAARSGAKASSPGGSRRRARKP